MINGILSVVTTVAALLFTLLMSVVVLITTFFNRRMEDRAVFFWCRTLIRLGRIRVVARGLENLAPEGTGVIYVFNHTSHYDIPILHGTLPRSFRFGAKAELYRIPFFGWAMSRARALKIERANLNSVVQVYDDARNRIASGESFILAPEGTRQADDKIGEFKTGPFVLAIQAQAPIVPLVIKGAGRILPKRTPLIQWGLADRSVQLQVLKPISTAGKSVDHRRELRDQVHAAMTDAFAQLD